MALTRHETQVTWPTASNTGSVGATSGQVTSEEVNLDATCIAAQIHLKADNSTTPASDDIVYFWLVQTGGDPDGLGADEFDAENDASALPLAMIDTSLSTTGHTATTNDPGFKTVPLPIPQKGFKIYAEGNTAGNTNAITVSATITEQRAA